MKDKKFSFSKFKSFLQNPSLLVEFQTETIKLIIYNYAIVLLIANQEVGWTYAFKDIELAKRLGVEVVEPTILTKFGFPFRMLTVIMNTMAVISVICPRRKYQKFLMPPIIWNVYTVAAIAENLLEILWTIFILEVPAMLFFTVLLVGIFIICLQSKLTLQVIRFHEYLNYIK